MNIDDIVVADDISGFVGVLQRIKIIANKPLYHIKVPKHVCPWLAWSIRPANKLEEHEYKLAMSGNQT